MKVLRINGRRIFLLPITELLKNMSIPQPHRNTVRAKKIRAELVEKLGGVCAICGTTQDLQFDHIAGARYQHNQLSYLARMNRYKREHELGQLRLLCGPCNLAERKTNDHGAFIPTAHASLVPLTADIPF